MSEHRIVQPAEHEAYVAGYVDGLEDAWDDFDDAHLTGIGVLTFLSGLVLAALAVWRVGRLVGWWR